MYHSNQKTILIGETKQSYEFIENLKITNSIVQKIIQWHQQQNKEWHDVRVKVPDFQIGDKVLIKVNKVPIMQVVW